MRMGGPPEEAWDLRGAQSHCPLHALEQGTGLPPALAPGTRHRRECVPDRHVLISPTPFTGSRLSTSRGNTATWTAHSSPSGRARPPRWGSVWSGMTRSSPSNRRPTGCCRPRSATFSRSHWHLLGLGVAAERLHRHRGPRGRDVGTGEGRPARGQVRGRAGQVQGLD